MGRDLTVSASLLEMSDPIEAILYFRTPSSDSYLEIPFRNKGKEEDDFYSYNTCV